MSGKLLENYYRNLEIQATGTQLSNLSSKTSGPSIPPTKSWRRQLSTPFHHPLSTSSTPLAHYKLLVIMSQATDKIIKISTFSPQSPPCSSPPLSPPLTSAIKPSPISSTFTQLSKKRNHNFSTSASRPTSPPSSAPTPQLSSSCLPPLKTLNEKMMFIIYIVSSIIGK